MAELNWMERNGLTRGKVALITTLAVVFVSVLIYQIGPLFFRGNSGGAPATLASKPKNAKQSKSSKTAARSGGNRRQPRLAKRGGATVTEEKPQATRPKSVATTWPKISVDEAIQHDPFSLPAELLAQMAVEAVPIARAEGSKPVDMRAETLRQLREIGVEIVILGQDQAVAAIGQIELREGDVINGLKVTKITRKGVEFIEVD